MTRRRTIDYDAARDMLCELARERPASRASGTYTIVDHFAPDFDGNEVAVLAPYCIIGHALVRWGVDIEELGELSDETVTSLHHGDYPALPAFDDRAARLLSATQTLADCSVPWANAVADAMSRVGPPSPDAPEPW